jgi:putative ABC transport system ATP-binding protein
VKPVAAAIAIEEVVKQYGTGRAAALVLDRVDLVVDSGEFIALMGPSGSGKSTLLNLIAGLDRPTSGRVWIGEQELAALSDDARSDLRLRSVGLVFQSFNLFPSFTAEENVIWPLEFLGVGRRAAQDRVRAALARVELGRRCTRVDPASSPEASSSASPSPAHSSRNRRSSWRTSPPATSTRRRVRRSCRCCPGSTASGG